MPNVGAGGLEDLTCLRQPVCVAETESGGFIRRAGCFTFLREPSSASWSWWSRRHAGTRGRQRAASCDLVTSCVVGRGRLVPLLVPGPDSGLSTAPSKLVRLVASLRLAPQEERGRNPRNSISSAFRCAPAHRPSPSRSRARQSRLIFHYQPSQYFRTLRSSGTCTC